MSDPLTSRALSTAAQLLNAAAVGDRFTMRSILRPLHEPGSDDQFGQILRAVSAAYRVEIGHILGGGRRHEITRARMATCYIAVALFGHGYAATGRAIGCDHTTVINAVRRVSGDPERRTYAEDIAERIGWIREAS